MSGVGLRRSLLLAGVLATLASAPGAHAAITPGCPGTPSASGVPELPGPALRLGINPAGPAGALGAPEPAAPDRPVQTLGALARLRPGHAPFALRLNRLFWSEGKAAIRRFQVLSNRYTHRNYLVELQVRYHPTPAQEGDIAGFERFVREVVDRFGSNPRVIALQVTNEVNLTFSPDSSDGAYRGAREALVQGVIAAKEEARRRHFGQLTVGFNWAYRGLPSDDQSFWSFLRDHGGPRFQRALDWVGLDAYPGTFFPPVEPPGGERDGIVNALSSLRECWMPSAGIGRSVPIHVEETGYPTGPGRAEDRQVLAAQTLVNAVNDFRATYGVSDLRWFDLRDHNSSSSNFQRHYGLLNDDYTPKPAFEVFRGLVAELTARPSGRVRVAVRVRGRGATLTGRDLGLVRRVDWYLGRRLLTRTDGRPFALRVPRGRAAARLFARAVLADGRLTGVHRSGRIGAGSAAIHP